MIIEETYTLSNGVKIPKIALGTWQMTIPQAIDSVRCAIGYNYRHIDTAAAYCNEKGVGEGIRQSGIARENIFITTKIPAEYKTYGQAKESIRASFELLGVDYIDLMLIHAPKPWSEMHAGSRSYDEENLAVWRAIEEEYKAGRFRAVGVSNFGIDDIKNITSHAEIKPMANQISVFVGHTPLEVMNYCEKENIRIMSYSPNATGTLSGKIVEETAKKYRVSVPQLSNRYDLQLGCVTLPKSTNPAHILENASLDFEISPEDMALLKSV